jgi:hypothetical protein
MFATKLTGTGINACFITQSYGLFLTWTDEKNMNSKKTNTMNY